MRFNTPVEYQTISQALTRGACPFCLYLKNFQSKILHNLKDPRQITSLCNFHAWAMAAASNKAMASCVFRILLQRSTASGHECSMCKMISLEEESRMKEFAIELLQTRVIDWINANGLFCIPHGTRLIGFVPHNCQIVLQDILKRNQEEVNEALEHLTSDATGGSGPGILGHAAEFLVSQRGL